MKICPNISGTHKKHGELYPKHLKKCKRQLVSMRRRPKRANIYLLRQGNVPERQSAEFCSGPVFSLTITQKQYKVVDFVE